MIESMLAVGGSRGVGVAVGDIDRVIAVNLVAPIKLVHALLPVLLRARNPRVLLLGALSGLDNNASREVANIAFKAGLRGAAQAMHRELAEHGIAVTVVNPGNLATSEVVAAIAEGRFDAQEPIPLTDFLAVMDCVVSTSLLIGAGTTRCIQRICDALSASSPSRGVFCRELMHRADSAPFPSTRFLILPMDCALSLSSATVTTEINLVQMNGGRGV